MKFKSKLLEFKDHRIRFSIALYELENSNLYLIELDDSESKPVIYTFDVSEKDFAHSEFWCRVKFQSSELQAVISEDTL